MIFNNITVRLVFNTCEGIRLHWVMHWERYINLVLLKLYLTYLWRSLCFTIIFEGAVPSRLLLVVAHQILQILCGGQPGKHLFYQKLPGDIDLIVAESTIFQDLLYINLVLPLNHLLKFCHDVLLFCGLRLVLNLPCCVMLSWIFQEQGEAAFAAASFVNCAFLRFTACNQNNQAY